MKKVLSAILIATFLNSTAYAWSLQGHQIVAEIAERRLTPRALTAVRALLETEGKSKMSEISSWADGIRQLPYSKYPNHTVRLPLSTAHYDPERDCKERHCIIAGIDDSVIFLTERKNAAVEAKVAALKYLIHFLGDIHQPLHTTKDIGMRPVILRGQVMSLHHVWDREIVRAHFTSLQVACDEVEAADGAIRVDETPVDWAEESRDVARDMIFSELPPIDSKAPTILPDVYIETKWAVASKQLKRGGYRLAFYLNKIFE